MITTIVFIENAVAVSCFLKISTLSVTFFLSYRELVIFDYPAVNNRSFEMAEEAAMLRKLQEVSV
jgi:hypothetical protein